MKVFYVFLFDELEETLARQGNTEYDRKMPNYFAVQSFLAAWNVKSGSADYGWTMHHEEVWKYGDLWWVTLVFVGPMGDLIQWEI